MNRIRERKEIDDADDVSTITNAAVIAAVALAAGF